MSNIQGTNVAAKVVPFTTDDVYPTHDSRYGKGGHREVADLVELEAIPAERRSLGMTAYVVSEDVTYQLKDSGWTPYSPGTGADNVVELLAAQTLGGHRVITLDGGYADSSVLAHAHMVAGITLQAVNDGELVQAKYAGKLTEPSWSWNPGLVFLGSNGLLTQSAPNSGFVLSVGTAKDATTILINITQPILLS